MKGKEINNHIKKLIANSKLEEAIAFGYKYIPDNRLILLSNRYFRAKEDFSNGFISKENYNVELNRITESILQLFSNVPKNRDYKITKKNKWKILFILFVLPLIDYGKLKGFTIILFSAVLIIIGYKVLVKDNEIIITPQVAIQDPDPIKTDTDMALKKIDSSFQVKTKKQTQDSLEQSKIKNKNNQNFGEVTDYRSKERKILYKTIPFLQNEWILENLYSDIYSPDLDSSRSIYIDNHIGNKNMGYLYSWQAAMKACPEGCQLPTLDDWDNLLNQYGGYIATESDRKEGKGLKTYDGLIDKGFQIQLAGKCIFNERDEANSKKQVILNSDELNRKGYFWTSTSLNDKYAWGFLFQSNKNESVEIHKVPIDKEQGSSCLCICQNSQ